MAVKVEEVIVTDHAADRWRERVALYGDEDKKDVAEAFRDATEVGEDEPLPTGCRVRGDRYFRHPSGAYFVAEALSARAVRIITVVVPGMPANPLLPKRKRDRLEKPEAEESVAANAEMNRATTEALAAAGVSAPRWQETASDDELRSKSDDELRELLDQSKADVYHAQARLAAYQKRDRLNRARWQQILAGKMVALQRLNRVRKGRHRESFQAHVGAVIPLARAVLRELVRYDFSADVNLTQLLARLTAAAFPNGMHDREGNLVEVKWP